MNGNQFTSFSQFCPGLTKGGYSEVTQTGLGFLTAVYNDE